MAHALDDGRSIMMIRSTSKENGELQSNIRWRYGHTTIPRHLRDLVVTEYGIADLRGRTDEEIIIAMVDVADSRFQEELLMQAKRAGKVRSDYRIPDRARSNRPERLEGVLARYRERGMFAEFPFGTDLTEDEMLLRKALSKLEQILQRENLHRPRLSEIRKTVAIPNQARPYLERMMLDQPHTLKERLLQRALVYALASVDAI